MTRLSANFALREMIPRGMSETNVGPATLANLTLLCTSLLEPVRQWALSPVIVHDALRLPAHNTEVGGALHSDHLTGSAADFHVTANETEPWEQRTIDAFHWLRTHKRGFFGQLILEDRRQFLGVPGNLWVHVSIPTEKHPGFNDPNAVLISTRPQHYEPWNVA